MLFELIKSFTYLNYIPSFKHCYYTKHTAGILVLFKSLGVSGGCDETVILRISDGLPKPHGKAYILNLNLKNNTFCHH